MKNELIFPIKTRGKYLGVNPRGWQSSLGAILVLLSETGIYKYINMYLPKLGLLAGWSYKQIWKTVNTMS